MYLYTSESFSGRFVGSVPQWAVEQMLLLLFYNCVVKSQVALKTRSKPLNAFKTKKAVKKVLYTRTVNRKEMRSLGDPRRQTGEHQCGSMDLRLSPNRVTSN